MTLRGADVHASLLERAAEMMLIEQEIEAAADGAGGVLVLRGPAGIGKTRLVKAANDCGSVRGLLVLSARPGPLERALPWGVARALLLGALADLPATQAKLAREVLTAEGAGLHVEDPRSTAVFALQDVVEALAADRPLLVLIDDLHWGDPASVRWLDHLAGRAAAHSVALIAALRSGERGEAAPIIDELLGRDGVRVHSPAPLSHAAVLELASAVLGSSATPSLAQDCLDATGGNPLLVRGLLDELGTRDRADLARPIQEMTPASLRDETARRMARESRTVQVVAGAAAVLGRGARIDEVAALAELTGARAAEAADRLVELGILASGGELAFVHPLVEAAVLASLAGHRRRSLHARAARILESADAPVERVATQVLAAAPSADPWNVSVLRSAAQTAIASGAPESAITYLERALAEPPADPARAQLLHLLGRAELGARREGAVAHLRTALDLTQDSAARVEVGIDLAVALLHAFELERADAVLAQVAGELDDADREMSLRVEAMRVGIGLHSPAFRHAGAARLRELEPAVRGGRTPGERLVLAHIALTTPLGNETGAITAATARRALGGSALLTELTSDSHVFWYAVSGLLFAEEFDEASSHVAAAVTDARSRGSRLGRSLAEWFAAAIAYRCGRLDGAVGYATSAREDAGGPTPAALFALQILAMAEIDRGRAAPALEALEPFIPAGPAHPMFGTALVQHARGFLHHALGATAAAVADIESTEPILRELEIAPWLMPWRSEAALVLSAAGRERAARELAAEELQLARRWGTSRTLGLALRVAALVQRPVDVKGLERAVVVLAGSGDRAAYARSLLDLGAALRRAGRRAAAVDVLRQSLAECSACGASGIAASVRTEIARTGASPRRVVHEDQRLTASEWRVAELAAQRLTNREIADALFITVRTVETHLTHTYAKLGVRGRRELAAALGSALLVRTGSEAPYAPQRQPV